MGKVHLLLWKFTHLDENADYMLELRELNSFLKITKKSIHPKKCSRTFVAYCDRDGDHKISLNEWYTCFGVKGKEYLGCHYFRLWIEICTILEENLVRENMNMQGNLGDLLNIVNQNW